MSRYETVSLMLFLMFPLVCGGCLGGSSDGDTGAAFLSGVVFSDPNKNGLMDPGEELIPGVTIQVSSGSAVTDTVTDGDGFYRVMIAEAGTCQVIETDPTDYFSTAAIPGTDGYYIDSNTLGVVISEADLSSGREFTGFDFGDVALNDIPALWIEGSVWIDANANGLPDAGESPLEGALVSLSNGPSQVTGADGEFLFFASQFSGIVISVHVTHPPGYFPTNALPGLGAIKVDNETLVVDGADVPLDVAQDEYISSGNRFGAVVP